MSLPLDFSGFKLGYGLGLGALKDDFGQSKSKMK